MKKKKACILLAEDSPSDRIIVERAIADSRVECDLLAVENGKEAMQLLRCEAPYDDPDKYPRPDLLLLDINMPVMDGYEVLKEIRADDRLRLLPVVILTTSARQQDVMESYRLGVNAYLVKPVDIDKFIRMVVQLEQFWFELTTLPPHEEMYANPATDIN